ncbi:MAG: alpha/beta hydrolase-fold protein [Myxococcota bacterium]
MRTLLVLVMVLPSCARWSAAPTPMTAVRDELGHPAKCLVVFLPGAGDVAADFERHGFFEEVRQRNLSVDLVAADATFGYYSRGITVERVHEDVVTPQLARGYAQVWVMGMSMGGLGTLLYAKEHAHEVHGVLALAPFLGDAKLLDELRAAGGLKAWRAEPGGDYQRELWRWLQATTSGAPGPELYLGWGTEDRLGRSAEVLAAALPPEHVFTVPGGHKWTTWRVLLARFLDASDFKAACGG